MIHSALALFRERGYSGTGLREINAHSGVARGAIYHHFPGGKAELAEEVILATGEMVRGILEHLAADGDAMSLLTRFVAGWRQQLQATSFHAGCSVAAIVAESQHEAPQLARAAAKVFSSWTTIIAGSLRKAGASAVEARRLATLTLSAIEGAIVLCRAERDTRALDDVGRALEGMYEAATRR